MSDPHKHEHKHEHDHDHGHSHEHDHGHERQTRFHDPQHAAEFDRRTSKIRADLAEKLADMLALQGDELLLDVATGTGRVARPVAKRLKNDPIIEEPKDSVDVALETKINQVFRRTHGENFRFHAVSSIQRLLTKAGYRIPRTNVLAYSFNQEGMDGIPTGRHWLEAALELEKEAPELAERMKKNYFSWHAHGDHVHVKGRFSYALITGVK